MRILKEYGTTIAIVVAAFVAIAWLLNPRPHPLEGAMAPTFALPDVSGQTIDMATHIGKDVVVLDFWASWCPPCRKGLPAVDGMAKTFEGQPVAVYAVNIMEGEALVKEFAASTGLNLPILMDKTGIVAEDYGVTGIPQTVIIDQSGRIHAIHVGLGLRFQATLEGQVQALLDGSQTGDAVAAAG